ncbi:iron chelate uptake ABC transporter family permease subunit [Streptoalloteichus hindustanus]|uniref:Iron complex transport system permease protein n=1 Tax=Streptoalloteichus hindustanus TaxID=2017 RepID=A0A1M5CUE2_STRHI|nr:iron chelate uptake ABC transporter family permease subunit [Streptoalloteichus hindustanus]SHF58334.1 iron complex transport system permease protein [Streptoalloteichus hindustanus]
MRGLAWLGFVIAAALVVAAYLCFGEPFVGVNRLLVAEGVERVVVVELRAPRLVLAAFAGAALGVAGLLLQETLRNPLAVPELLGVSSGAAAAVSACVVFGIAVPGAPLVPALVGAVVGGSLTLLAARGVVGPAAVLLVGAAVSAATQALMLTGMSLSDSREQGVLVRYLLGSLTGTTWNTVGQTVPGMLIALPLAFLALPAVGLLRLGEDNASVLGLRAGGARVGVLAVACVLVAAVVGPCGPIAWVGFLAPRLARAARPNGEPLVWFVWCAGTGALLVVVADLLARTVLYPIELPVGGLTAAVAVTVGALLHARRRGLREALA